MPILTIMILNDISFVYTFYQLAVFKVLDPNGLYINLSQTKIWNIDNFGILSVVVCSVFAAYTSFCKGLKCLLKVRYIILLYPKLTEFLIFEFLTLFGQVKNIALCLKKISEKWTAFVFGSTYPHQTFTECISNQYARFDVLICQM